MPPLERDPTQRVGLVLLRRTRPCRGSGWLYGVVLSWFLPIVDGRLTTVDYSIPYRRVFVKGFVAELRAVAKSDIRSPPTLPGPVPGPICAGSTFFRLETGLRAGASFTCQPTLLQPWAELGLHDSRAYWKCLGELIVPRARQSAGAKPLGLGASYAQQQG